MSPFIHGRIYPEVEEASLLSYELRILIDPASITSSITPFLIDFDILRSYLRDINDLPCRVTLLAPAQPASEMQNEYGVLGQYGVEILSTRSVIHPKVAEVFSTPAERSNNDLAIASSALWGDADFVVVKNKQIADGLAEYYKKISMDIGDWNKAKQICEVFVRGHEVPWSFTNPIWGCPYGPFYTMTELRENKALIDLYTSATQKEVEDDIREFIRSLVFNRCSNICYTRDKLLFYQVQRLKAERHKLTRQNFSFELGYFLNHQYLLLWGGLDQICWIVNGVFGLGFGEKDWMKVGVLNKEFLKKLTEVTPELADIFKDQEFIKWVKMLRGCRHFVAHSGIAMPGELYFKPEKELLDEEIDKEIEQDQDWQNLKKMLPKEFLEKTARPTMRLKKRLKKLDKLPDAVMKIKIDDKEAVIFPLVNIEWDFNNFMQFAEKVAIKCTARIMELWGKKSGRSF